MYDDLYQDYFHDSLNSKGCWIISGVEVLGQIGRSYTCTLLSGCGHDRNRSIFFQLQGHGVLVFSKWSESECDWRQTIVNWANCITLNAVWSFYNIGFSIIGLTLQSSQRQGQFDPANFRLHV